MAASGTEQLASSITTVNGAIGETSRSAGNIRNASASVATAAERLAAKVQTFFVRLRTGPFDRREGHDPDYSGPERRANPVRNWGSGNAA